MSWESQVIDDTTVRLPSSITTKSLRSTAMKSQTPFARCGVIIVATLLLIATCMFCSLVHLSGRSPSSSSGIAMPTLLLSPRERDLCSTQAIKLPDCDPHFQHKAHSHDKYSPYVIKGKKISWKKVKQVIQSNPKVVMKDALQRTRRERQALDNIDSKEEIEEEKVKQTLRRLVAAKTRLEELQKAKKRGGGRSEAHSEQGGSHPGAKKGGGGGGANTAAGAASGGRGLVPEDVITAMATTMKSEQQEIRKLRSEVKRMAAAKKKEEQAKARKAAAAAAGQKAVAKAATQRGGKAAVASPALPVGPLAFLGRLFGSLEGGH
mmetsp:Transcript_48816/g.99684  ORF Transcript_48816/g.99684 Transcript_48816/m.99684 type:complete len:321 (+) Transcript_48816:227-1189(+)